MVFRVLTLWCFFDLRKGRLKPRKEIEIKVPRRSRVEILIPRISLKGPIATEEEAQTEGHSEFWATKIAQS